MAARLDLESGSQNSIELPLLLEDIDTTSFLKAVSKRFNYTCSPHKVELSIDGELPTIMTDQRLLKRVIDNLLDNAEKYSDQNSPIKVEAHDKDHTLYVKITDQGIGIEEKDLGNIFKPFFPPLNSLFQATPTFSALTLFTLALSIPVILHLCSLYFHKYYTIKLYLIDILFFNYPNF